LCPAFRRSAARFDLQVRRTHVVARRPFRHGTIAFSHGNQWTRDFLGPKIGLSSTMFCQFADICIDLDGVLADPVYLLPDGHWSASGHAAVALALLKAFRE
jgi:hypothetical protein